MTVRFAEELLKPEAQAPTTQCVATVHEGVTASLSCSACGAASTITGILFASFGTASGGCTGSDPTPPCAGGGATANDFKLGACNAANTSSAIETLCKGKHSCTVPVSTAFFGEPCHRVAKWLNAVVSCSGGSEASFTTEATTGNTTEASYPTCIATNTKDVGRPCFDMRTGSRYEDVWTLPAATLPLAARGASGFSASGFSASGFSEAQNHEYIVGRFGELIFNDTSVKLEDVEVSAWVVRQRYGQDLPASEGGGKGASMSSSSAELDAVFELTRYTSEATSLDLYSDSNARQRSADCMADANTAMRLAYSTSSSLALQNWAMKQALTLCGNGRLGKGGCRAEWTVLPLVMVRDDLLMTGDTSFAKEHFDALVPNALGQPGTDWPIDPNTGLVNSSNVSLRPFYLPYGDVLYQVPVCTHMVY